MAANRPPESAVRNAAKAPRGRIQTYTRPVPAHREPVAHPPPPVDPEVTADSNFVYLVDDVRWHPQQMMPAAPVADPRTQAMHAYARPQPLAADLMPNARAVYELPALQPVEMDPLELELGRSARPSLSKLALWSVVPGIALFGAVLAARVLLADPATLERARGVTPVVQEQEAPATPAPEAPSTPAPAVVASPVPVVETPAAAPESTATKSARSARLKNTTTSSSTTTKSRESELIEEAAPAAAPAPVAAAAAEKPAAEKPAETAAPSDDAQGYGMLRLNSRPWSQVTIDGKSVGNTPLMGVRLSAGKHDVDLFNPAMNMRKKIQVMVDADDVVTRVVTLDE